jgi:hypothetical protein
MPLI